MQITPLGHNGLRVVAGAAADRAERALLINPWLDPSGAGSWSARWHQGPACVDSAAALQRVAAVVITHARPDHLDPFVLRQLPADVPVLIPRLVSPLLRERATALAVGPVIELAEWQWHPVSGGDGDDDSDSLRVLLVPELAPCPHAAVVVQAGAQMLVDLNAAQLGQLPLRTIRQLAANDRGSDGVPDVVVLRPVPATLDPLAVQHENETKREYAFRRARLRGLELAVQALRVLQARTVVPLAGSPIVEGEHAAAVAELVSDGDDIAARLEQRMIRGVVRARPGDSFRRAGGVSPRRGAPGDPAGDPDASESTAVSGEAFTPTPSPGADAPGSPGGIHPDPPAVVAWFTRLLDGLPAGASLGLQLKLVAGDSDHAFLIDFRPASPGVSVAPATAEADYELRVSPADLADVIAGRATWDDLIGLLAVQVQRGPRFRKDQPLVLLQHAGHQPEHAGTRVRAALAATRTIRLPGQDGGIVEFERHCPHAGLDLADTGELLQDGSALRCVAHHYEFSLNDGGCLNAACRPLRLGPDDEELPG